MSSTVTSPKDTVIDFINEGENGRRKADGPTDLAKRIILETRVEIPVSELREEILQLKRDGHIRCRGNGYYSVSVQE